MDSFANLYPPWVVDLKPGRRIRLVCLPPCKTCQPSVAFHHCSTFSISYKRSSDAALILCCEAISWVLDTIESTATYPIPCVKSASRRLAPVLHALESCERCGTKGEELRRCVNTVHVRCIEGLAYANHNPIREESFKRDTHGCDCALRNRGMVWTWMVNVSVRGEVEARATSNQIILGARRPLLTTSTILGGSSFQTA